MKVFVAGSEGLLMRETIPLILGHGHEVVGVDWARSWGGIESHHGDLADPDTWLRYCPPDVDVIVQAAAHVYGVRGLQLFPADIIANNLAIHTNALRWAAKIRAKRVVTISSSLVYPDQRQRASIRTMSEDMVDAATVPPSPIPRNDYGLAKLTCDRMLSAFSRQYDLDFTSWRPFNIVTAEEQADYEPGIAHVIPDLIEAIIIRKLHPIPIIGDGFQIRCFTWVGDVAQVIASHLDTPQTRNEFINLGNPNSIKIGDLASEIFKKGQERGIYKPSDQPEFQHLPAPTDEIRNKVPSTAKAERLIGWAPKVQLDEMLDICIDRALVPRRGEVTY